MSGADQQPPAPSEHADAAPPDAAAVANGSGGQPEPTIATFYGWEKAHPKPLTGRHGTPIESSYSEKPLSVALAPGSSMWLIAPYVTPLRRRIGCNSVTSRGSLEMRLLLARVVDSDGERDSYRKVVKARDEWWSGDIRERFDRVFDELQPIVWSDAAGLTLAWRLAEPFTIATAADARRWRAFYLAVRTHLLAHYQVTLDGDGVDLDALFPAPTREPAGDRRNVPVLGIIPFPPAESPSDERPPGKGKGTTEAGRAECTTDLLDTIARTAFARTSALTERDAAVVLADCSDAMPDSVRWTQYENGKRDTRDGAAKSEPFTGFGAMLTEYASCVVSKGAGRSFIGAVSTNGRCRDADIKEITIITLDCDGHGEWDRIRHVLEEARLGYVAQRSSSHTPQIPKWHLSLALARGWAGSKHAWRAIWRFVVGAFAGVAGLVFEPASRLFGFDHSTDRLGQPIFPAAKRAKDQAAPETVVVAGRALDLDELLVRLEFDAAWYDAPTAYEPREPSSVEPTDGLLALAFARAGMLGQRIERESIGGFAVECPNEHLHSTGCRFDGSTMIADPSGASGKGFFICLHAHCGNMKPDKVLSLLPEEAVDWAKAEHANAKKRNSKQKTDPDAVRIDDDGATADDVDLRNAERLVEWFGDNIRYVRKWQRWLGWDSKRWHPSDLYVEAAAKQTARRMLAEAREALKQAQDELATANEQGDEAVIQQAETILKQAERAFSHAVRSQNVSRVMAMITLARSDPRVVIEHTALNSDPWLLNVQNGTVEMKAVKNESGEMTVTLREHRRGDLITQLAPVGYAPDAKCPTWDKYVLEASNGRHEVVAYLRRIAGYCMTGSSKEEAVFFFYGPLARNGKGTWTQTQMEMLGPDYAGPAARRLLFKHKGERHDTEIADLYGKRLVVCSEIDEGEQFDETKMKDLTGRDPINARRMREDPWKFVPTHKFVLHGQFRPNVRGDDEGTWGRLLALEWEVSFKGREDRNLKDKLREELAGIFADSVRGCLEWQAIGLAPPEVVKRATEAYRAESDRVGAFIAEHLVFEASGMCAASEVRRLYEASCEEIGEFAVGAKRFWARVHREAKRAGVETSPTTMKRRFADKVHTVNGYRGVRLVSTLSDAELRRKIDEVLERLKDRDINESAAKWLGENPDGLLVVYTHLARFVRERNATGGTNLAGR